MSVRRSGPLVLAALLAGAACSKSVSEESPRQTLVIARYASPSIPTPNDLALQAAPTLPDSAQKNLLLSLIAQGGFPADQAPTLSVPIRAYTWDAASNRYTASDALPTIDGATVTGTTAALFRVDVSPPQRIEVEAVNPEPPGFVNFVPVVQEDGSRRLSAGRYVFAVRGGDLGVKTTEGLPIAADVPIALTIPNKDLTNPNNQPPGGIPDTSGNGSNLDELGQLQAIQTALWAPTGWVAFTPPGSTQGWLPCAAIPEAARPAGCTPAPAPAYPTIDAAFPHAEVASIAAFQIAPPTGETVVAVDAASGQAPLPFDLLRTGPDGHIAFNPSFGPAAQGLTSLEGFSTTAMILAQVITPGAAASAIDAGTVPGNVRLYKLGGGSPELLSDLKHPTGGAIRYVSQPTPIIVPSGAQCPASGGCSGVIGLQPAVNTGVGVYIPALEEDTTFAVVITKGVHDLGGHPLGEPTLMKLIRDPNPLVHPTTHESLVGGLDAATAGVLQQMKTDVAPLLADDVALAYTFKTQKVTHDTMQLAGLPYQATGAGTVLGASFLTPAEAAAQYGIDATASRLDAGSVASLAEVQLGTVNLLLGSQNQGAFDPAHPTPEPITALVALPAPGLVTGSCPGGMGFTAAHCAPLVVFRHGITRSKADLLPIAAALTSAGFVVAAIDAEKHGDRSWCTSDQQCCPAAICGTASTCSFKATLTGPTDGTTPIGVCEAGGARGAYLNKRVDCRTPFLEDGTTPNPACFSPKGVPYVSGNFLVSLNFFRTRDSLRQDVIDQSALVKALAPYGPSADAFAQHLKDNGDYAVDPTQIYWVSQSLGSIQGAVDLAANPRFSNAVFNAPGATLVDIFANPESSFHDTLKNLIKPIEENTPDYLKLLQVAKWILDPADPANFAPHVLTNRLTSPLDGQLPGLPGSRNALAQFALCDPTIPNTQNAYFASQLGLPVPAANAGGTGRVQWFINSASTETCPDDGATHGFLLDGVHPTLTVKAQTAATTFLASPSNQAVTVRP